jgi:diphthamide biosynthesis enzyme Dph1/Dph2-like protein
MSEELELNLELEKVFNEIETNNHKNILIQLPDGLKPKAGEIQQQLLNKFKDLIITFWAGDCYGACDTPNAKGFDLFVAFGHSVWRY